MYRVGDLFHNDYTIIQVMGGEGITGESEVYVIKHNQSERRLVIKTPQKKFDVWQGLLNLQMEDAATQLLSSHPNFVKCYGLMFAEDGPWLALEYVDGITLNERLEVGGYRFFEVVDWWVQIANAIDYIRRHGQIYMDLSADNIMVTPDNRIKLIDLGRMQNRNLLSQCPRPKRSHGEERSEENTDLRALGEIIQRSYNLCLVEELKRGLSSRIDQESLEKWEAEWKHMADSYETLYKTTGAPGILTSPEAPEKMAALDDQILDLIGKLRTSDQVDFGDVIRSFSKIHQRLGTHNGCAVEDLDLQVQADAHCYTAWKHLKRGHVRKALRYVDKAIAVKPDYATAWRLKADILRVKGHTGESLKCYERSLKLGPEDLVVLVNFGTALVHAEKFARAEELLLRALELAPTNPVLLNNLGFLYEEIGQLRRALSYYRRALQVDPNYDKAKKNLEIVEKKMDTNSMQESPSER